MGLALICMAISALSGLINNTADHTVLLSQRDNLTKYIIFHLVFIYLGSVSLAGQRE